MMGHDLLYWALADKGLMDKLLIVTNKRQTRTLVKEGATQRQDSNVQTELISGHKSHSGLGTKTYVITSLMVFDGVFIMSLPPRAILAEWFVW
jgi:hypothetical protein